MKKFKYFNSLIIYIYNHKNEKNFYETTSNN